MSTRPNELRAELERAEHRLKLAKKKRADFINTDNDPEDPRKGAANRYCAHIIRDAEVELNWAKTAPQISGPDKSLRSAQLPRRVLIDRQPNANLDVPPNVWLLGVKRTWRGLVGMSVNDPCNPFRSKLDNVRLWHLADQTVRFSLMSASVLSADVERGSIKPRVRSREKFCNCQHDSSTGTARDSLITCETGDGTLTRTVSCLLMSLAQHFRRAET